MVDILTALSMHPHLEQLELAGDINDEGLEVLIPVLKGSTELLSLRLANNHSITSSGWQRLATILEAPNFNLAKLLLIIASLMTKQWPFMQRY